MQHNHVTRDIKAPGLCPACDDIRFSPTIASKAGEPLEVTVQLSDNASNDEIAAAMEAAAREAGLL